MFRTTFDAENKQWNGVKTNPYYNRETSLGEMILNSLQVNDTKVAQVKVKRNFMVFFFI